MTQIGQEIIDLFVVGLYSKSPKTNKTILQDRDSEILSMCYDFENNEFMSFSEIANRYDISRERIRQIHTKALKKLNRAGRNQKYNIPNVKLFNLLEKSIHETEGDSKHLKVINFWHENLDDFPGKVIIRLISHLVYSKRFDIDENILKYKEWLVKEKELSKKLKQDQLYQVSNESRINDNQQLMLNSIIWFDKITKWEKVNPSMLKPKRKVNNSTFYYNGVFESIKCGKEISYESGLEYDFITNMETFPKVKQFAEQPLTIKYHRDGQNYNYTPDFAVLLDTNEIFIVEVKDFTGMADSRVHKKMEALITYCKENGFGILLTNGKYSIDKIITRKNNMNFENEILKRLEEKKAETMYLIEVNEIQKKHKANKFDLLTMVLHNNLNLQPYPFKLKRINDNKLFRKTFIKI